MDDLQKGSMISFPTTLDSWEASEPAAFCFLPSRRMGSSPYLSPELSLMWTSEARMEDFGDKPVA
jgi:hypothetical protein